MERWVIIAAVVTFIKLQVSRSPWAFLFICKHSHDTQRVSNSEISWQKMAHDF